MSTHTAPSTPTQTLISLPVCRLLAHPLHCSRMSAAAFNKLVRHLERTGRYEPIVVCRHRQRADAWQILNGHARVRALTRLGHTHADCVVFDVDEAQGLLYLATLNKLTGRDNVHKKCRLIERLCGHFTGSELARLLPDSRTAIEKLNGMAKAQPTSKPATQEPFRLPLTFFVTEPQHRLISEAFDRAVGDGESGTRTEKRLLALCRIAKDYLGKDVF